MPRKAMNKDRISASISPEQKRKLQTIADQSDISLSRIIQEAIKEFIEAHPTGRLALVERSEAKPS